MCDFWAYVAFNIARNGQTDMNTGEGGSVSTAVSNSNIQLSSFVCCNCLSVCRFVKGQFAHCFVQSILNSVLF